MFDDDITWDDIRRQIIMFVRVDAIALIVLTVNRFLLDGADGYFDRLWTTMIGVSNALVLLAAVFSVFLVLPALWLWNQLRPEED